MAAGAALALVLTGPKMTALVDAGHIGLTIGDRQILHDISFSIEPEQITTIIGPNGAGKSTLVQIVIGLNTRFDGTLKRQPGLKMAYVPQKSLINPLMPITVHRLLTLTCKSSGESVKAALQQTGVDYLIDQQVSSLSGGEMQRVMLARCLLGEPDLLVLDEPTAGVDITGEAQMYDLIAEIRDQLHCAVLMVSHDLHMVMSKTDQVLCLNHHLCCYGKPESVSRHPEYLALFGDQAGSIAVYTHHHDHEHDLDGGCAECRHNPDRVVNQ
jgi:zinc transport system ATP-binding protein